MKKIISLTFATLLGAATPALAGDISAPATYDWSGLYGGVYGGGNWASGRENHYYDVVIGNPSDPFGSNVTGTSLAFGGFLGVNKQFSNGFVAGVELDLGTSSTANGVFGNSTGTDPKTNFAITSGLEGSGDLRLGYAVDRVMPYVMGGASYMTFGVDALDNYGCNIGGCAGQAHFTGNGQAVGWNIGAGVNYAVSNNIVVGAEYRYTQFGPSNVSVVNLVPANNTNDFVFKLNESSVRATLAFKF